MEEWQRFWTMVVSYTSAALAAALRALDRQAGLFARLPGANR
jgi:hypothetical protein